MLPPNNNKPGITNNGFRQYLANEGIFCQTDCNVLFIEKNLTCDVESFVCCTLL